MLLRLLLVNFRQIAIEFDAIIFISNVHIYLLLFYFCVWELGASRHEPTPCSGKLQKLLLRRGYFFSFFPFEYLIFNQAEFYGIFDFHKIFVSQKIIWKKNRKSLKFVKKNHTYNLKIVPCPSVHGFVNTLDWNAIK